jgi:hypothetical protein
MTTKIILIGAFTLTLIIGALLWVLVIKLHLKRSASSVEVSTVQTPRANSANMNPDHAKVEPTPITRSAARSLLSFDYKWHKDEFGVVMLVDFSFNNRSPYDAKDISLTCRHFAPSGTEIDSNTRTIYEVIPAHDRKTVKDFNMGFIHSQVSSTICTIDDFEM